jgi:ubiquitin conjugation factor E4 B
MLEAVLLDPSFVRRIMSFYNLVIVFILRTVYIGCGIDVQSVKWNQFVRGDMQGLEFGVKEAGKVFSTLPEWMFEDICEYYLFVVRHCPKVFENSARDEFFCFAMFFLKNAGIVRSPYLKSKLIEVLFMFRHALNNYQDGSKKGELDVPFSTHPFCKDFFVDSIVRFYVGMKCGINGRY